MGDAFHSILLWHLGPRQRCMFFSTLVWHDAFWSSNIHTGTGSESFKFLLFRAKVLRSALFCFIFLHVMTTFNPLLDQCQPKNFQSLIWLNQKSWKYLATVLWIIEKLFTDNAWVLSFRWHYYWTAQNVCTCLKVSEHLAQSHVCVGVGNTGELICLC